MTTQDPTMKNLYSMGTVQVGNNPIESAAQNPTGVTTPVVTPPVTKVTDPTLTTFNQQQVNPATKTTTTDTTGGTTTPGAGTNVKNFYADPTMNDLYGAVSKNYGDIINAPQETEQQIRDRKLKEIQAEIDSTNTMYASKLQSAKVQGANRLGQGTAIQARRGLIGSDFGSAQTDNINSANTDIYNNIEAEKTAAINALISKANSDATAEFEKKTTARSNGLKEYLTFLQGEETRKLTKAQELVASLLASDIDPTTLPKTGDGSVEDLAKSYGLTTDKLFTQYSTAKKASDAAKAKSALEEKKLQAEIDKANIFNVSAGQKMYRYDPATGKTEVIAYNPKTATGSGSGGGSYSSGAAAGSSENIIEKAKSIDPVIRGYAEQLINKQTTLSSIPANLRNQVALATKTIGDEKGVLVANQILKQLDNGIKALQNPNKSSLLSGSIAGKSIFGFSPARLDQETENFRTVLDTLKSAQTINAIPLMKGTGPLSNVDMRILENSQSELSASLDEATLLEKMIELRNEMEPARLGNQPYKTMQPQGGINAAPENQNTTYNVGDEVEINGRNYRVVDDAGNLEEI